jgi:DHA1 family tetracycline resistance protein-like MFS transporter
MSLKGKDTKVDDAKEVQKIKKYVKDVTKVFFAGTVSMTLLSTASTALINKALGTKSKVSPATLLGRMASAGALAEFLSGPAVGRLSDAEGRKKYIIGGMLTTAVLNLLVASRPKSLFTLVMNRFITTATNTAFITILRAGLADLLSGSQLGAANGAISVGAGLGVIFGPFLGATIDDNFGPATTYAVSSAIGFGTAAYVHTNFQETLTEEKKKKMDWKAANPLSFVKLLTSGKSLATLAVALGFQCIAEPRFVFPYAQLLWRTKYKYSAQKMGAFGAFFGLIYVIGTMISKKRFKKIGSEKHVTECNMYNTLAFLSWSVFNGDVGTFMSFLLFTGGIRKRDGLETMIMEEGDKRDWGKGETTAITGTFKSVSAIFAPELCARAANAIPNSGAPMLVGAVATIVSELIFRMRQS